MYRYANGVVMIHGGPSGCTFTGTEGTLRIDRGHLTSDPDAIVKEPLGKDDVHLDEVARATTATGSTASARASGRWPTSRSAPARWPSSILGNLAYWNHRRLRWDPASWEFVGDAEANRWLDRERRPWQLPEI